MESISVEHTNEEHLACPLGDGEGDCNRIHSIPQGETLFNEGEEGEYVYCLHEGKVAISRKDSAGVPRIVAVAAAGDLVGVQCLVPGSRHTSTATTIQPCILCMMDRRLMMSAMSERPALTERILREMCRRLGQAESHLDDFE